MAETFTIRRRIEIDAAHRVPDHASKCFNLHGHRYVIEATMEGELRLSGDETGMVMDFGFLKGCMMSAIHDVCDHATIFWVMDPLFIALRETQENKEPFILYEIWDRLPGWKIYPIGEVPTAEQLARIWYYAVQDGITSHFDAVDRSGPPMIRPVLTEMRVWETPNCVAWYSP